MSAPPPEVGRTSIRVAFVAAAVVAIAYLVIAIAVVAYVTGSLTAQVDARLTRVLDLMAEMPPPLGNPIPGPPGDRPLAERALWSIGPDGTVSSAQDDLELPAEHHRITTATTAVIAGNEIRIAGTQIGASHVIVGESLELVNDARATVILGELLIAPVLLVVVFVGAVAIGRRVAAPIEAAHQRQLDFTADASHELRTPLAVIEANATLALAQQRDAAWYRRAFEKIDGESKRMRRLLDDLLWLARVDTTRQSPGVELVNLAVLARQAVDRFAPVAEAKHLSLRVDAEPDAAVVAPAEWIDRLLGVLLDNACRYSPEGGTVRVRVSEESGRAVLTVDDSGPGIPDTERDRIFSRFHRATDGAGGAGLGLAIGDAVVRGTGGRWKVANGPAGGARISVIWPRGASN